MINLFFWLATTFIVYTYIGYPVIIWLLSRMKTKTEPSLDNISEWPTVAVVVPVYNEVNKVSKKLENLRSLRYQKNKLHIIFVSDGSDDGTNDLLDKQTDITFIAYHPRKGKPFAINTVLKQVTAEIVVFSDVRQEIASDSVLYLVARLMEPGIGAVSGELVHHDSESRTAKNVSLYWRYEKWIRKSESRYHSLVGVTGALYAIRSKHYVPLKEDTLIDDFEIPINIIHSGYRVVMERKATAYDFPQVDLSGEQNRKIRTLTGNFQSFSRNLWLLSPRKNAVFLQLLSHKVFRLFVPYALLLVFLSSWTLDGPFYTFVAFGQTLLYSIALAGMFCPSLRRNRIISFTALFVSLNWAAVSAFRCFLFNKLEVKWKKT